MTNITTTEWKALDAKLAAELARRWPWLHDGALRAKTPILTAHAELRWARDIGEGRAVQIFVDSSGCISGGALDIANAARMIGEVRDAMLFIHGETSGLVVWRDGECPCGFCGTRGTSCGVVCDRCKGTGKR